MHVILFIVDRKDLFVSWPGAMIIPQWLEIHVSRPKFHGPKDVRAIEVRLYQQQKHYGYRKYNSGPSCSKLTTFLVNDSLNFTLSDMQIC